MSTLTFTDIKNECPVKDFIPPQHFNCGLSHFHRPCVLSTCPLWFLHVIQTKAEIRHAEIQEPKLPTYVDIMEHRTQEKVPGTGANNFRGKK